MRILNVYLKNLNSLAGEWFIDFENPTLQAENLFLISGPTGAGKSTLLDAISLALYGRTPRLDNKSSNFPSVSEIMTRHASEACAEVLFESRAGRFLASWSQKRKKGKNPDNFKTSHVLVKMDNGEKTMLADKLTTTPAFVSEYAGLTYTEFTRAIMLAQGSFAAFLTAPANEKGLLLEKLANAGIYRTLSKKAYDLNDEAQKRKKAIQARLQELGDPQSGEEEELQALIEAKTVEKNSIDNEMEALHGKIQWRANLDASRAKVESRENLITEFETQKASFAPQLAKLAFAKKISPAKQSWNDLSEIGKKKETSTKELQLQNIQIGKLEKTVAENDIQVKNANDEFLLTETEMEKIAPVYDAVLQIDNRISILESELQDKKTNLARQEKDYEDVSNNLGKTQKQKENLDQMLAEIEKWLDANSNDAWLVENFSALKIRLANLSGLKQQISSFRANIDNEEKKLHKHETSLAELGEEKKRKAHKIGNLESALQDARKSHAEMLAGSTQTQLEELLKEQNKILRTAEVSANLSDQRALLVDEEPCPLCGSLHHPWAENFEIANIQEIRNKISELENRLSTLMKIGRDIDNIENELKVIRAEETALLDKESGQLQFGKILRDGLAKLKDELENITKDCATGEEEIKNTLEPLHMDASLEFASLAIQLEDRLNAWRANCREKENLLDILRQTETSIATLAESSRNAISGLAEKKKELEFISEQLINFKKERFELFGDREVAKEKENNVSRLAQLRKIHEEAIQNANNVRNELAQLLGGKAQLEKELADLIKRQESTLQSFNEHLKNIGINREEFIEGLLPTSKIEELEEIKTRYEKEEISLQTSLAEAINQFETIARMQLTEEEAAKLQDMLKDCKERYQKISNELAACNSRTMELARNRDERQKLQDEMRVAQIECDKWGRLDDLIGSSKGDNFVRFAQNVTLDLLVRYANSQLANINNRYQLARSQEENLSLVVIDTHMANQVRPVGTLSGGETFLVSLSLALGLSAISSRKTEIGSLFLDEGFGSLDSNSLVNVMDALYQLRNSGRLTGIISHIEQLKEKIHVHLEVKPLSGGHSTLDGCFCSRGRPSQIKGA